MAKTVGEIAEKYLEAVEEINQLKKERGTLLTEINRLKEENCQLKKERGFLLPGHTYVIKGAVIKIGDDAEPGEEVIW